LLTAESRRARWLLEHDGDVVSFSNGPGFEVLDQRSECPPTVSPPAVGAGAFMPSTIQRTG
jgi:hypothetical protein